MGYFRLFYYIAYIFNTICRIIKRHGKQILWVVCIFGFLIFCMWPTKSRADYTGTDYDYADGYKLAQWTYNRDVLGFLRRYENVTSSSFTALKEEINNNFHNDRYNYFIFRGGTTSECHGEAISSTYNYNNNFYYIVFYHLNPYYWTRVSNQYTYYGIEDINMSTTTSTDNETYPFIVYRLNSVGQIYKFSTSEVYNFYFYAPDFALLQGNEYIYEYFYNNTSLKQLEELYSINNSLDTITDNDISTETEDTVEEAIEDIPETFDNSYTQDIKDNEDTLLNTILTPIYTYADGTTTRRINFTLPFVDYTYQLRSDAISSHIRNTNIYTYIQLFWWFAFSIPIFMLLRRIVVWLGTGEFLNKPSRFAVYMSDFISKNITPGMM